jgi:Trk-type K+ transport system membrane component
MNFKQKIVLVCISIAFLLTFLRPPFVVEAMNIKHNLGYHLVFNPPSFHNIIASINHEILLTQWIGIIVIGINFILILRSENSEKRKLDSSNSKSHAKIIKVARKAIHFFFYWLANFSYFKLVFLTIVATLFSVLLFFSVDPNYDSYLFYKSRLLILISIIVFPGMVFTGYYIFGVIKEYKENKNWKKKMYK